MNYLYTNSKEIESGIRKKQKEEVRINGEKNDIGRYIRLYLVAIAFECGSFIQIILCSIGKGESIVFLIICIKGLLCVALVDDYVRHIKNNKILEKYLKRYSYTICVVLYIFESGVCFINGTSLWWYLGGLGLSIVVMLIFYLKICEPIGKIVYGIGKGK